MQRDFRVHHQEDESREAAADDEDDGEEDELDTEVRQIKNQTETSSDLVYQRTTDSIEQKDAESLVFDISDIENCSLLKIEHLNEWDYPIFEVANSNRNFILSKVSDTGNLLTNINSKISQSFPHNLFRIVELLLLRLDFIKSDKFWKKRGKNKWTSKRQHIMYFAKLCHNKVAQYCNMSHSLFKFVIPYPYLPRYSV